MDSNAIAIISLIIAALSTVISILSFFSNKRELIELTQSTSKSWIPIATGEIKCEFIKNKSANFDLPMGIMVHLQILNPSPKDIAYFHVQYSFDDRLQEVWTKDTVGWANDIPKFLRFDLIHGYGELPFIQSPQGCFKANSLTPFYLYARLDDCPLPKHISVAFRYSVRKFPYIGKRNHFSTYELELDTSDLNKMLQSKQEAMKQLTQKVPTKPNSSKHPHNKRRK